MFGLFTHAVSLIAVFFIPESPKFLSCKGRFSDARKSLAFIAKFNRVKNYDFNYRFNDEIIPQVKKF